MKSLLKIFSINVLLCIHAAAQNNPNQSIINSGNITSWIRSDGFHDWVVSNSWNGSYPKGINVGAIFSEGIIWGGLVHDSRDSVVRVAGSEYATNSLPLTRLYRVRSDYFSDIDLRGDAADFFHKTRSQVTDNDIQTIYKQYEKDWNEWPAEEGAPFYDKNNNGIYEPDIDIPGVPGAVQTLFIKYYDSTGLSLWKSPPIGLEVSETYWAYYPTDILSNVIFKKVDIVYKGLQSTPSIAQIDSMYICQWADTDLGSLYNDFAGTDTSLNMGYSYNSSNYDENYNEYLSAPPAIGYAFLQGVSHKTGNLFDSAVFNFKWRHGYKYFNSKPLTVALISRIGDTWGYPSHNYHGTLSFYNMMRGYFPLPGYPSSRTVENEFMGYGTYQLAGDPVTGTGMVDGINDPAADRGMWLMTGPFNLKLGDTAEVVIALVGGIGSNNLNSITKLRYNTKNATLFFYDFVNEMTSGKLTIPYQPRPTNSTLYENYVLYQNYPNPFNSTTSIRYELPAPAHVTLIVYDILGREVLRLVDENKSPGSYSVNFNADNLPSGVYFYKISFLNQDNKLVFDKLYKVNKLILLK